jgi:hypothetical protein
MYSDKILPQSHFAHYKTYVDCIGIEPGRSGERQETNRLSYGIEESVVK